MVFSEGNQLFAGDFHAVLDEINGEAVIYFNLQRNGTGNGLSNIKDTFAESFHLQISLLHQSMCIFKAGLSGLSDGWAKYKENAPKVSDSNQNIETKCNSKLKFTELKRFIHQKRA